ncbi:pyocin activator PrtN family protein [uncultured Endozoicomonas sp.]|uniref:pyocin activator PrtN family protein n=1 Tax=uncultured Endozoicomonas sp. TaxID=432652 RepID=UPI0026112ACF|nr:pyocin activator PrtN family protein [uncultured Endozoicomonas sp.]
MNRTGSQTEDRLFKQYGGYFIPLEDCCKELTGVGYKRACEQIRNGSWPFPVAKLHPNNRKSPYIVDVKDLAKYMDECFGDVREDFDTFDNDL